MLIFTIMIYLWFIQFIKETEKTSIKTSKIFVNLGENIHHK